MKVLPGAVGALTALLIGCTSAQGGEPPTRYVQRRAKVDYRVDTDKTAGRITMELYLHVGGGKWKKQAEVKRDVGDAVDGKLTGEFLVERKDEGAYDFVVSAVDERGNRSKQIGTATRAENRVVIDRTPPWIIAKRLTPLAIAAEADKVHFAWATRDSSFNKEKDKDEPRPVSLQAKLKQEKDWQTIKTGLPLVGKSSFPELAAVAGRLAEGTVQVRFKAVDRAGNVNHDVAGNVLVDRKPPRGRVTGPVMASSLELEVFYEVADQGPAGLADVGLWISADGGESWLRRKEKVPFESGTVRIKLARAGKYGLYLSARDAVGNVLKTPEPGTKPHVILLTDTAAPRLALVNRADLENRAFSGRDRVYLKWKAQDENLASKALRIDFSSDGGDSWSSVESGLANEKQPTGDEKSDKAAQHDASYTGSYWWQPPKANSTRCLLRISARDEVGNETRFVSRPFTIDNKAPRSSSTVRPADESASKAAAPPPERDRSGELSKKARSWLRRDSAKLTVDELTAKANDMLMAGETTHSLVAAVAALKAVAKTETAARAKIHLVLCRALMVADRPRILEQLEQAAEAAADSSKLAPLYAQLQKGPGKRLKARLEARAAEHLRLQAVAHLAEVIKLGRDSPELADFYRELLKLSRSQTGERLKKHAGESAAMALMIVPDSVEGHMLRGRALVGIDDEQALAHLERVVKLAPSSDGADADLAAASFNLGKKRAEQGKRKSAERLLVQAAERYERVVARRDRSAANHYNLAQALTFLSRVERDGTGSRALAESHFRKALNVGRRSPNVYANSCYWLGTLREQARDWPMATRYWDSAARVYGPKTQLGKLAQARADRSRGRR